MQEVGGEGQRGEVCEDEAVHAGVQALQAVQQGQLLQEQEVVLTQPPLQVLAAQIHHPPHLDQPAALVIRVSFPS